MGVGEGPVGDEEVVEVGGVLMGDMGGELMGDMGGVLGEGHDMVG